jgi:hypothetical protein
LIECFGEGMKWGNTAQDFDEAWEGGGEVREKIGAIAFVTEESVSAEGLHEALHGGEGEDVIEIIRDGTARSECGVFIKLNTGFDFGVRKFGVRV